MCMEVVFVYKKEGKIKCLNLKDSLINHDKLIFENWVHVNTIDACTFLEHLSNERHIDLQL